MRLKTLCVVFLLFFGFQVDASPVAIQGHIRTGVVNGTFSGAETGEFSVMSSLEGEFEYFYGSRGSMLAKATLSLDPATGQYKYLHMGLGQRFYLFSRGRPIEGYSGGISASIRPKMRYFVDWGLGLSQIQVRALTSSISVQTTSLELGLGGGAIYQLSQSFGIGLNAGWSRGISMSSVAVDSTIIRVMVGAVAYF
jgi:hypothetical protein